MATFRKSSTGRSGGRKSKPRSVKSRPGKSSGRGREDKPSRAERKGRSSSGDRPFTRSGTERREDRPERAERKGRSSSGDRPFARPGAASREDRPERAERKGRSGTGDRPFTRSGTERREDRPERAERKGRSGSGDRPFARPVSARREDRPERSERKGRSSSGDRPFARPGRDQREDSKSDFRKQDRNTNFRPEAEKGPDRRNDKFSSERSRRSPVKKRSEGKYFKPSDGEMKVKRKRIGQDEGYSGDRKADKTGDAPDRKWNRKESHEFFGNRKRSEFAGLGKTATSAKTSEEEGTRLNKYIANAGICSRREADEMIEAGVISVNGNIVTELGTKVFPGDIVKYNNETLRGEQLVYILLNKPKDFITTTDDPDERKTVMSLIAKAGKERVYPVGRLDRNTTGVLLFTNDGDLARKLTHPSFGVQKIYQVELDSPLKKPEMDIIKSGVQLDDGFIKVDEIAYASPAGNVIGVELHSGRNRIVRRIFEHLNYKVKKLDRVVFAGLTKKDLPRGRWRYLTELEIANLKMITGKHTSKK